MAKLKFKMVNEVLNEMGRPDVVQTRDFLSRCSVKRPKEDSFKLYTRSCQQLVKLGYNCNTGDGTVVIEGQVYADKFVKTEKKKKAPKKTPQHKLMNQILDELGRPDIVKRSDVFTKAQELRPDEYEYILFPRVEKQILKCGYAVFENPGDKTLWDGKWMINGSLHVVYKDERLNDNLAFEQIQGLID